MEKLEAERLLNDLSIECSLRGSTRHLNPSLRNPDTFPGIPSEGYMMMVPEITIQEAYALPLVLQFLEKHGLSNQWRELYGNRVMVIYKPKKEADLGGIWIAKPEWVADIPERNVEEYIETMKNENKELEYFSGPAKEKREGYVGMYYKLKPSFD